MKLLIITQKIDKNDGYFGFFHDWVSCFASKCEKVTVISLETYTYDFPDNVEVMSLGKEKNKNRFVYFWRLFKYSFEKRKDYDAVFCHMSPIYVIAGFLVWKILHKKISLWYVHRSVDLKLRIAHTLSDIVFTATKESFRISSKKAKYMGQAVDIGRFSNPENANISDTPLKIITVGRITPIKKLDVLIRVIREVKSENIPVHLDIVGPDTLYADREYKVKLEKIITESDLRSNVSFVGSVPNISLPRHYWQSNIFVNLSPTGGLDKAVLEAMASKLPVIVANRAFENHLNGFVNELLAKEDDVHDLAQKIVSIYRAKKYKIIGEAMYKEVQKRSSLDSLLTSIIKNLNETVQ